MGVPTQPGERCSRSSSVFDHLDDQPGCNRWILMLPEPNCLADTYIPAGVPPCNLLSHPDERAIVAEALEQHRERLLEEIDQCEPEVVVTLGNAAGRMFASLGGPARFRLSTVGYGQACEVDLGDRAVTWIPLTHPAAPLSYQIAHEVWLGEGIPPW